MARTRHFILIKLNFSINGKIKENNIKIDKILKLEDGVSCDHCFSSIDKSNYFHIENDCNHKQEELNKTKSEQETKQSEVTGKINNIKSDIAKVIDLKNKIVASLTENKNKVQSLQEKNKELNKIQKPEKIGRAHV